MPSLQLSYWNVHGGPGRQGAQGVTTLRSEEDAKQLGAHVYRRIERFLALRAEAVARAEQEAAEAAAARSPAPAAPTPRPASGGATPRKAPALGQSITDVAAGLFEDDEWQAAADDAPPGSALATAISGAPAPTPAASASAPPGPVPALVPQPAVQQGQGNSGCSSARRAPGFDEEMLRAFLDARLAGECVPTYVLPERRTPKRAALQRSELGSGRLAHTQAPPCPCSLPWG